MSNVISLNDNFPDDWKLLNLKDIVDYKKGKKPKIISNESQSGFYPYLSTNYLRNGDNKSKFAKLDDDVILVNDGDLLLLWDGSNAGEFFIGKQGLLSSTMVIMKLKINDVHLPYLFYVLKKKEKQISNQTRGTGIPHVDRYVLESLPIPLPPLHEQEEITKILSCADFSIKKSFEIIAKLTQMKKSFLNHLLFRGTTSRNLQKTSVGEIPENWNVKPICEISDIIMGQSPPGSSYNSDSGVPLLNGPTEFGDVFPKAVQFTYKPTKLCKTDDVLICVRGNTTGRINRADKEYCIGRGLAAIRPIQKETDPVWLYYQFLYLQKTILLIASGGGSTFPNINKDKISNLVVPYPPIDEQKHIAIILCALDTKINLEFARKQRLQQIKQGLMNDLLTGKKRLN